MFHAFFNTRLRKNGACVLRVRRPLISDLYCSNEGAKISAAVIVKFMIYLCFSILHQDMIRGFIDVCSRIATGFHRWLKPFELNFL